MTPSGAAVVLGASGSVGQALMTALVQSGAFRTIATIARRPQPDVVLMANQAGVELREMVVPDMDPAGVAMTTETTSRAFDEEIVLGFSVMGIGANTARLTIDEHRAVDVDLNAAFARGLKASGRVTQLAFMSSVGADPTASTGGSGRAGSSRYLRVKGESEEAVKRDGPAVVNIFRPAMIIGSRHTPRLLEKVLPLFSFITPARFRSITVEQIARAMVATSLQLPATSRTYHFGEMTAMARDFPVVNARPDRAR